MADQQSRLLSTEAVVCVTGRLISLFVHELNNHLATLNESTGLADDILSADTLADREKLKQMENLVSSISSRINNAAALTRVFGDLGRHAETRQSTFDMNKTVEGVIPFFAKMARQKNIRIKSDFDTKAQIVSGDPIFMQCLLFALFENRLSGLDQNAVLTFKTEKKSSSTIASIHSDLADRGENHTMPWTAEIIDCLSRSLSADISHGMTDWPIEIRFKILQSTC